MSDQSPGDPPHVDDLLGRPRRPSDLSTAPLAARPRSTRRSLCLLIDISWSIERDGRTADLNRALAAWPDQLRADGEARRTLDVAIVVMGPNHEAVALRLGPEGRPFTDVDHLVIPELHPDGTTPLDAGLRESLKVCRERSAELTGQSWRRPRLVVITDGQPTDATGAPDHVAWRRAAQKIRKAVDQGTLRCLGIAVGETAAPTLREFCKEVVPMDGSFEAVLQHATLSTYYPEGDAMDRELRAFGVSQ